MEREGVEADDAYSMLCDYSRRSNRPFGSGQKTWWPRPSGSGSIPNRTEATPPWLRYRRLSDLPTCSTGIATTPVSPTAICGCATSSSAAWRCLELEAILYGALEPSPHDREVIAHALNERFVELGGNHPVPYAESDTTASGQERPDMRASLRPVAQSRKRTHMLAVIVAFVRFLLISLAFTAHTVQSTNRVSSFASAASS